MNAAIKVTSIVKSKNIFLFIFNSKLTKVSRLALIAPFKKCLNYQIFLNLRHSLVNIAVCGSEAKAQKGMSDLFLKP